MRRLDVLQPALQIAMREFLKKHLAEDDFAPLKQAGCPDVPGKHLLETAAMHMADAALAVVECSLQSRGISN